MNVALLVSACAVFAVLSASCSKSDNSSSPSSTAATAAKPAPSAEQLQADADAEMAGRITGSWVTNLGDTEVFYQLSPSHDLALSFKEGDAHFTATGTWRIRAGQLQIDVKSAPKGAEKLLGKDSTTIRNLSDTQWTDVENIDGTQRTLTWTRISTDEVASRLSTANDQPSATTRAKPQNSSTEVTEQSQGRLKPFMTSNYYVASKSTERFTFVIYSQAQVDMVLDISEPVPISVVFIPGDVPYEKYMNLLINVGLEEGQREIAALFGNDARLTPPDKKSITTEDVFSLPFAKKGAYGHYDSGWHTLKPGTYTVFLDNEGNFSPVRGDAPVNVALYAVPSN